MTHCFVEFVHVHILFMCRFDGAKLGSKNGSRRNPTYHKLHNNYSWWEQKRTNVVRFVELQAVTRYLNRLFMYSKYDLSMLQCDSDWKRK